MKNTKIYVILFSVLILFLISACTSSETSPDGQTFDSPEDFVASCPPLPGIPLGACPETGGNVQWTYDEQGCIVGYECGAAPAVDAAALDTCLARCEELDIKAANEPKVEELTEMSNYRECQVSCYGQRAKFTKDSQDCNPILELARQNPNYFYARYFGCMMEVGQSDPSLCDVAQGDKINYPYCIRKIALETKDAAVCDRLKGFDPDNWHYNNCVESIQRGY